MSGARKAGGTGTTDARTATYRLIAVACRDLGIDDDARKAMLLQRYGTDSRAALTDAQLRDLVDHLKASGFTPKGSSAAPAGARRSKSRHGYIRKIWALWGNLVRAGVIRSDDPDAALLGFINRHLKGRQIDLIGQLEWLTEAEARPVIEALKDWCKRQELRVR